MITQDLVPVIPANTNSLTTGDDQPITLHPIYAYIGSLRSKNSQRGMKSSLQKVTEYYVELAIIQPMLRQDYSRAEAIQEAVNMGFLVVQTIKRGKNTGQPKLNKQGNPITIGNPFALDWSQMNYVILQQIFSAMNDNHVEARTVNHAIAAVRGVMKKAKALKLITAEEYETILSEIKIVKITTEPKGRDIDPGEIKALAYEIDREADDPASIRDLAILAALRLGLRISEVAGLRYSDLDMEVGQFLVHGKGNKERLVPINLKGLRAIRKWVALRGSADGPLFLAVHKSGAIQPPKADKNGNLIGMTRQAITKILKERGESAGIKAFTAHDFRRTFAGDLLDAGADIVTVQKLMGHANPTTTSQYDRRSKKVLFDAVSVLDEL